MKVSQVVLSIAGGLFFVVAAAPAQAGLIINPNFASNITSDANSAAIEGAINSAIATYESTFSDPITVDITFQEGGGLGGSSFNAYSFTYTSFYNALVADGKSADDATALARLAIDGSGTGNPINGGTTVLLKAPEAHALGLNCGSCGAHEGGTITLNTNLINPGSSGTTGQYNLLPVVEHEIDEILGLGSTLGVFGPPDDVKPSPEDFYRFTSGGARSFNGDGVGEAFFSIDGTTDLAQFDNQNDGGDFGDWRSSATPQVQDAFGTPGSSPALGVELRALDVIGYDLVTTTPEPGTFTLLGSGFILAGLARRRMGRLNG